MKKTLEYISSFNQQQTLKVNATEEMHNLEESEADKAADSVAESVTATEGIEKAENQNDKMYHNDVSESQLKEEFKEDAQQTEIMVLKAISDTDKEILNNGQTDKTEKKTQSTPQKQVTAVESDHKEKQTT